MSAWAGLFSQATPPRPNPVALGQLSSDAQDVAVMWLIDSGASVPVVRRDLADQFLWKTATLEGQPPTTTDGTPLAMWFGPELKIVTSDGDRRFPGPIGVKRGSAGSNLIGMQVLQEWGVTLVWNPLMQSGCMIFPA